MECDICCREYDSKRLPFLCPVDARNQLYEPRFQHLRVSLERDRLGEDIENLLASAGSGPAVQTQPDAGQDAVDAARASQRRAETRTSHILAAADQLRNEIQAAREDIKVRKAALARRRSDLASLSNGLPERRERQSRDVDKSIQRLRYRWAQGAEEMASCRSFLCTEAAYLYGMDRVRLPADVRPDGGGGGGAGSWEYRIGKVPVVELRDMNSLSPELITTSLGHISHVLMLASHYLSIRLPAEITLPHRDYPSPTIYHVANSYKHPSVSFPDTAGSTGTSTITTTPDAPPKDSDGRRLPRPRPLFIHKSLPQLLKDDPSTYSYFIEAVSLLAYDIAWLCSTQGMTFGEKHTFDEVCQIGRNLYTLLIDSYPNNSGGEADDKDEDKYKGKDHHHNDNDSGNDKGFSVAPAPSPSPSVGADTDSRNERNERNWIGRYSHGTTYYHLGGADGTELVRTFKLPNPSRIADKLKKKLIGDAPIPDWEILEDDAWKVEEGDVSAEPKSSPPSSAAEALRNYRWTRLRS